MWEGTPTQRLWGILESKLSYQVLESRFKCNQGARNVHVHFSASNLVHACNKRPLEWYKY